jgi:hypothetical protein
MGFRESLPRWKVGLICDREDPEVNIRPAPAAPVPGGSMAVWIWLALALAVIVVAGYVLSSRG